MKITPELVRKFRNKLSEIGQERTIEESTAILQSMVRFVRDMKRTSQADLWASIEEFKEQNPDMSEEELQQFVSLLYYAKEL